MRTLLAGLWALSLATGATAADPQDPTGKDLAKEGFVRLFDGKSFKGWEGNLDWFRIEAGAVVAGRFDRKIPRNEFLCTTRSYGDFELRLEVKLHQGKGNAGIQFRTRRIPDHHEVSGYQADVGPGWWGARFYDESRRRRVLAGPDKEKLAEVLDSAGWNRYVIRCQGPRVQLWLNGHRTVDYVEKDADIERTGIIGLQIHGGPPAEVRYREIWIKPL